MQGAALRRIHFTELSVNCNHLRIVDVVFVFSLSPMISICDSEDKDP